VIATTGHEIIYVTLAHPLPYRIGMERISAYLEAAGRPRQALCAVALRLPAPLSFQGFIDFNAGYRSILQDWEILIDDLNPIARTNVAPAISAPSEPMAYGFAYTAPATIAPSTFVVAGAGDLRDQADLSPTAIVRPGDTSPEGMLEKATCVADVMEARLHGIGMSWTETTTTNIYTVHPITELLEPLLLARLGSAAIHGIHWYYSRPPIQGLEFEMDLRSVRHSLTLDLT
jgi:hypothetical protein